MRRWWRCARGGHEPHVYDLCHLMPGRVIVRCTCGRGLRPRIVPLEEP